MRYLFWFFLVFLILLRFWTTRPVYQNGDLIRISTTVTTEPCRYPRYQYFKLEGLKVYLPPFPQIAYGDWVVVEGRVEEGKLLGPKLLKLSPAGSFLLSVRRRIISFYQRHLPEREAALVSGMVLGVQEDISKSFWQTLRDTGTAHVVVASGMNVTLVAGFLLSVCLSFLGRKKAATLAIAGVWIYTSLAGAQAPLVRAAIMATLALVAQITGRLYTAGRALILTGAVMLLVRPDWLVDLGFLLSFAATLSLMLFEAKIARLLSRVPLLLREGLSTSLAAQIGVAPIIFVTFGQFNPLSPLINALVLWTVAPLTIIGAVAGIVGLIWPALGAALLYLSYPLSYFFVEVVRIFA